MNPWEEFQPTTSAAASQPTSAAPWEEFGQVQQQLTQAAPSAGMPWDEFKTEEPSKGVALGGLSDVTTGFGNALFGSPDKAAAMLALSKTKPGTKEYAQAERQLEIAGGSAGEAKGIAGTVGEVLGGSLFGIGDVLTGGGGTQLAAQADEYLRQKQMNPKGTPQQWMEAAKKYGMASEFANISGAGVGQAKSRLATAAKQGVAGLAMGAAPEVGAGRTPELADLLKQGGIAAGLGALLHQRVMTAESGGNQKAVSPKGAVGVMQLMPSTGPEAAKLAGLPWDPKRFKEDASYNAQLGKAYLDKQVASFDGNEQLGAAAYNAGAGNVKKWIDQFGDPRKGEISMDEFINKIPFDETRKYVKKLFPETTAKQIEPIQRDLFEETPPVQQELFALPEEAPKIITEREPLPVEREVDNHAIINDAMERAKLAGRTEDIGRIERELVPVTDIAKAQKNPVMDTALALIEREGANAKDLFRKDVLGEHFTANPLKSGHEIGGTGMAEWLNAPKKEQIAVLEKYKQFEGMDIPVTQELLGASNREWHLYQNLRVGLDDIARKTGVEVASNYLPKSRIGDWGVVATGPNGYHFEAATNKLKLDSIIRDLKKKGFNILGSGLKDELYAKNLIPGLGKRVVADHNKALGDLFAGHREEAQHIPGWSGQRDTADLVTAIAQYTKKAEFENVRDRLVQVDKALRDSGMAEQYPRMYQRLREHMDQMIGMGFIHQHSFGNNIIRTAQKHFGVMGDLITPTMHGTARAFNSMKVMAAPARHIVAGTLGNMQTAAVFLAEAAQRYGINTPKFLERQAANSSRNTFGMTPEHLRPVIDRAIRSGYLVNSADITGLTVTAHGNPITNALKELAHDPGRAGRWDLKARKDFFLGTYEYALRDMKMSPENAFHTAGKWTREAFVGTRPQDRALWIQRLGAFSPVTASLTTYANSLAGKLYAYTANRQGAMAPLLTIFGTSIALAGLRGTPLADLADMGIHIWNMITSNKDEADKRIASFDAFMLDLEKQYPQMKWVMSGMPSAATGADLSRSLSWPSIAQLVPGWELAKAKMAGQNATVSAPIESFMDMLGAVKNVASAYARGEEMGEYEKQRVIQQLLPRQFGQLGKTTDILNKRDEKIGEISPEDLQAGNIFAGRSLAEAEIRGQEANVQERLRGQQERIKLADQRLITTLTAPGANPARAIKNWTQSAMKFGEQGIISDPSKIIEGAFNREMGRMTTPQERAVLAQKYNEVLLRQKVGQ